MASQKHVPTRTCVGCRTAKSKRELIRVVRTPEGLVELDNTGKKSGRGAYLCPSTDCLEKAIRHKQLERALKCEINTAIKESIARELDEANS